MRHPIIDNFFLQAFVSFAFTIKKWPILPTSPEASAYLPGPGHSDLTPSEIPPSMHFASPASCLLSNCHVG